MNTTIEQWTSMALAGQWEALLDACRRPQSSSLALQASLWQVRALRALGRGEEANEALRAAASGKLEAQTTDAVMLAEELLQCAFYAELEPLIAALASAKHPAAHFLRAGLARERALWPQAVAALQPLDTLPDPWPALARLALAWIRLKQGWLKEAETLLAPFAADETPATQKLWARFELAAGEFDKARARLERLATRQPLDWEWPVLLAAAQASLGTPAKECLNLLEQGLRRQPRHAEGWALAMRLRLALNDEQNAQAAMSSALAIKPWLDAAVVPMIERLVVARRFEEAKALLAQLRKLADTPQRQAVALDLMRLQGAKVRDLAHAAEALAKRYQENPDVLRTASAALLACRRKDPAALLLERVLTYNPHDKAARNNLAALYRERGDIDDALVQLRTLVEEGDLVAKLNLAKILLERGDYFEAESLYQALAQRAGTDLVAQIERGMAEIQARRGDLAKALALAVQVCEKEPSNAENWILQAKIVGQQQGASAAVSLLATAANRVDAPLKLHRYWYELLRGQIKPQELVTKVRHWREAHPGEVEYHFIEAAALQVAQDWAGAEAALREAVRLDPAEGTVSLVRFYLGRVRLGAARRVAEQWVRDDPTDIRRWAQLAEVCHMEEKPLVALEAVEEGLKRDPTRLSLVRQKMGILLTSGRHDEAIETVRRQWQAKGELAALMLLLDAMGRALRFDDALLEIEKALCARPNERVLRLRLARQLRLVRRDEESLAVLQQLFAAEQGSDTVAKELIGALMRLDRFDEASAVMRRFAAAQPERLDLHVAIAGIALEQGLLPQARAMLQAVREQAPDLLEAWVASCKVERRADDAAAEVALWRQIAERFAPQRWARGAVSRWVELELGEELQAVLNRWRETEPDNVAPWWVGFEATRSSKLYSAATSLLDGIERRQGTTDKVLSARASVFNEAGRMSEAIALMKQAVEQTPSAPRYLSQLLGYELKVGNWEVFDGHLKRIEFLLGDRRFGEYQNLFFNINCHPTWDARKIYGYYRAWYDHEVRPYLPPRKPFANIPDPDRKLRIGYVSPDFRQHAVAKFSEPILKAHDREQFTLFAYAHLDHKAADAWTGRFRSYFDHWREIRELSLDELERQIREDQIDILVDLAGHSSNHRLHVFMRRPAPILASHVVGAGQTTGMSVIDYLIASPDLWPSEFDDCAAETVARVAFTGGVYNQPEDAPPPEPLPCLKLGYLTFGVFARPLRVSNRVVRVWAEILKQTPGSRLRFEHQPYLEQDIQERYQAVFAAHGIAAERLEFANTRPYWTAFHAIDLQLDPFPAGSGTTATEGLYMERLVVALKDRPVMGRGTSAQLAALGLTDACAADSEEEYIAKAVALAGDFDRCASLSHGLRERFVRSPILDYNGYAEALAATYRQWWQHWCERGEEE